MIAVAAWIAKQERIRISERVRAGLDRARAHGTRSGRPVGRPRVVFRRDQVVEHRNRGESWRQTAKACGIAVTTARRAYQSLTSTLGVPKPDK
jgi:DNA invertase Pin-like site-specific DNA recombinase